MVLFGKESLARLNQLTVATGDGAIEDGLKLLITYLQSRGMDP